MDALYYLITTSAILLVGLFFGFNHLTGLKEHTLEIRKRAKEAAALYEKNEKWAYNFLIAAIALLSVILLTPVFLLLGSCVGVTDGLMYTIDSALFFFAVVDMFVFSLLLRELSSTRK